jgi:hypothetical protein
MMEATRKKNDMMPLAIVVGAHQQTTKNEHRLTV